MGGYGSGQPLGFKKGTVEGCPSLRIEQYTGEWFANGGRYIAGRFVWTYSGTNKEILSIGYEVNTLYRHDAWVRFYCGCVVSLRAGARGNSRAHR
jgi:hypothetical protein